MTGRIEKAFAKAKAEGRGAFVAYLTAGYPSMDAFEAAADDLVAGGADILEIGVPFSDPFADGAVIRQAAYAALRNGTDLDSSIAAAARIRARHPETGIVLFSYCNPLFSKGYGKLAGEAQAAGIDAVLAVDLPLEERGELLDALRPRGIGLVPLVAPNTPLDRVEQIAAGLENTFIYAITVKGVTGERAGLPADLAERLDAIRSRVALPVAAGFGISTMEQARAVCGHADGFIVGSALVRRLGETGSLKGPPLP